MHTIIAPVVVPTASSQWAQTSSRPRFGISRASNPRLSREHQRSRGMCTETSGEVTEHEIMYLEDSEGNVVEEATVKVGAHGLDVFNEEGELVGEWGWEDLQVVSVKVCRFAHVNQLNDYLSLCSPQKTTIRW